MCMPRGGHYFKILFKYTRVVAFNFPGDISRQSAVRQLQPYALANLKQGTGNGVLSYMVCFEWVAQCKFIESRKLIHGECSTRLGEENASSAHTRMLPTSTLYITKFLTTRVPLVFCTLFRYAKTYYTHQRSRFPSVSATRTTSIICNCSSLRLEFMARNIISFMSGLHLRCFSLASPEFFRKKWKLHFTQKYCIRKYYFIFLRIIYFF